MMDTPLSKTLRMPPQPRCLITSAHCKRGFALEPHDAAQDRKHASANLADSCLYWLAARADLAMLVLPETALSTAGSSSLPQNSRAKTGSRVRARSRRLLLDVLLDLLYHLRDGGLLGLALGLLLLHLLPEARGTPALDLCAITTKVYVE